MLCKAESLLGYTLGAQDGEFGSVKDFYFDDQYWAIRYLVAETGSWLKGKRVLISPHAMLAVNEGKAIITTNLTKKQIEASPSWDSDRPVSRQFEIEYYGYYGWPMYWSGASMWGSYSLPGRQGKINQNSTNKNGKAWDPHLRSANEVVGNHIHALDGEIGHVDDFVIDDGNWAIRYLIVDTQNWWPGKRVLMSPRWIERVSWDESKVYINLNRESIKQSPEYTEESLITREYELGLHRHYNREGYWVEEHSGEDA